MSKEAQIEAAEASYRVDDQIGFILRLAFQYHTAIFTSRMIEGLTQTQFVTLAKLLEIGPVAQSELGRQLMLDSATLSGVIERMAAKGTISLALDPSDRRRQLIALTESGRELIEQAQVVGAEISRETLSYLTTTERDRLVTLLRKMMYGAPDRLLVGAGLGTRARR